MATIKSIEEKAKAYDIALDKIKRLLGTGSNCSREELEYVFPELRESNDERIRKALIRYFTLSDEHAYNEACGVSYRDIVAWLERQREQKPDDLKTKAGNWYVCDMEVVSENMVTAFRRGEIYYCPKDGYLDVRGALFEVGCLDVFRLATEKEIPQPKQEWSKEDEYYYGIIQHILNNEWVKEIDEENAINWFKSLKERYTWKPSDEQMELLLSEVKGWAKGCPKQIALESLYQDLKKLRGE